MTGIRLASAADRHLLLAINAAHPERTAFITDAIGNNRCLVHAADEVLTSFVITTPRRFFGRDFVDLLIVSPAYRRRGAGRELLDAAVATATTPDVFTSTNQSNHPMRALLEQERWTYSGRLIGLDEHDPELVFFTSRGHPATAPWEHRS